MTGMPLLVLMVLGTHMDADGTNGRPSQATLATETGLGERTVRRHLADAVAAGWLHLDSRGHRRGDGTSATSTYSTSLPAAYGHLRAGLNRPRQASRDGLNRPNRASQPANGDISTGHPWPPTSTTDQKETSGIDITEPSKPKPIDPEAKKAAGSGLGALRAVLRPEGDAA